MSKKRVLVVPLDWGLGHATRCTPIINALQELNCDVFIAGAGSSLKLLRKAFPELKTFELPPYNPAYPSSGSMMLKLLLQSGKFVRVVRVEHRITEKLVEQYNIDFIISDNRYGCYSLKVPSVFITHQLTLPSAKGWKWLGALANSVAKRFVKKFTTCWVPDFPGSVLSGKLSVGADERTHFIGPLSRLNNLGEIEIRYKLLVLLSGPEPQRSIFETIVMQQLESTDFHTMVVRGVVEDKSLNHSDKIVTVNYLDGTELSEAIAQSELVLCRSGYSTIMDLARLQKKAIFVPTPGQTEQEYLAEKVSQAGIAYYMSQKDFVLDEAMRQSENYKGFADYSFDDSLLRKHLTDFLHSIN
ncbi:MAG: hypothetical protein KF687_08785 [Cyclobacteriaceae bacterium]|nr:hypothetical protein [Cyclobacteriaceae bacterium]